MRNARIRLAAFLIMNRWWVFHCAAAIRREEETPVEDLNTPVRFIHDHKFLLIDQ